MVTGPDGKTVGKVPKNHKGLYLVEHHPETANIAVEDITLYQLHCQMGHISAKVTQKLIKNGLATGLRLETTASGEPVLYLCQINSKTYPENLRWQQGNSIWWGNSF